MGFATTEQEWAERAARHLKVELTRADLTYDELAERMKAHGFKETKAIHMMPKKTAPIMLATRWHVGLVLSPRPWRLRHNTAVLLNRRPDQLERGAALGIVLHPKSLGRWRRTSSDC
ncbi:DUF6471 domain-containing protein [Mesorhizobium sp. B3-1-9]|uniref:DUF6471 domain-containing protein n=1 Tax=Mesorhizobium sp. B3-1-9 TaxID=2589892 RepID=UPI002484763E|nr:DUF6471 domain-containing protein [Mesorhizobium sp. B3-1-9]